jgi:hypothetical protein
MRWFPYWGGYHCISYRNIRRKQFKNWKDGVQKLPHIENLKMHAQGSPPLSSNYYPK